MKKLNYKFGILLVYNYVYYFIGQETFRSIVSAYYNSSDAIIVVYDITSYRSI